MNNYIETQEVGTKAMHIIHYGFVQERHGFVYEEKKYKKDIKLRYSIYHISGSYGSDCISKYVFK